MCTFFFFFFEGKRIVYLLPAGQMSLGWAYAPRTHTTTRLRPEPKRPRKIRSTTTLLRPGRRCGVLAADVAGHVRFDPCAPPPTWQVFHHRRRRVPSTSRMESVELYLQPRLPEESLLMVYLFMSTRQASLHDGLDQQTSEQDAQSVTLQAKNVSHTGVGH